MATINTIPLAATLRLDYGIFEVTELEVPKSPMPERQSIPPTGLAFEGALNNLLRNNGPSGTLLEWLQPKVEDAGSLSVPGFNDGLSEAIECMDEALKSSSSPDSAVPYKRALRLLREIRTLRDEGRAMYSALFQG